MAVVVTTTILKMLTILSRNGYPSNLLNYDALRLNINVYIYEIMTPYFNL